MWRIIDTRIFDTISTAVVAPMPRPLVPLVVTAMAGHMASSCENTTFCPHRPSFITLPSAGALLSAMISLREFPLCVH